METKPIRSELLYIEEHLSCRNYMTTIETGFKYLELDEITEFEEEDTNKNYLLFLLQGDFSISCNQFHNKPFHAGEMILIPRSSRLKGAAQAGSSLLSMFFDIPENSCDKLMLQSLSDICDSTDYNFEPVGIRYPLTPFLDTLIFCIKNGMSCAHLHNLMQREFFFLLRGFYEKREIATLLHPIIGKEMGFKDFVIYNHNKVDSIEQLVELSHMGRSRFFSKFTEVFGMTAKKWMLKQKDQQILNKMTEPGICIKDVIEELGFDSQVYFNRYCKQHFGCTPRQLMERCQTQNKPVHEDYNTICTK